MKRQFSNIVLLFSLAVNLVFSQEQYENNASSLQKAGSVKVEMQSVEGRNYSVISIDKKLTVFIWADIVNENNINKSVDVDSKLNFVNVYDDVCVNNCYCKRLSLIKIKAAMIATYVYRGYVISAFNETHEINIIGVQCFYIKNRNSFRQRMSFAGDGLQSAIYVIKK